MTGPRTFRRALARGAAVACPVFGAALGAQTPTIQVSVPAGDTLASVTPPFVVSASGFGGRPLRIRLQLDSTTRFTGRLMLDTTVTADSLVVIRPSRALDENARVFYRATASDPASGASVSSPILGPKISPLWVTLVSPPTVIGQPVRTRTPRFVWRSPQVSDPPGPWNYTITITNLGQPTFIGNVGSDTSFVPTGVFEPNAVYSWSVAATLPRTIQGTVSAARTFVVQDSMGSIASTDMFPAFPNPFPGRERPGTCIWLDLKNASEVQLDVYDLRGLHVRRLVPNPEVVGELPAGAHGRGRQQFNEGCDRRFEWDGTDDRGRYVPEGVYLIRFKADGVQRIRKVLFKGPR